jgi:hypothetical protein
MRKKSRVTKVPIAGYIVKLDDGAEVSLTAPLDCRSNRSSLNSVLRRYLAKNYPGIHSLATDYQVVIDAEATAKMIEQLVTARLRLRGFTVKRDVSVGGVVLDYYKPADKNKPSKHHRFDPLYTAYHTAWCADGAEGSKVRFDTGDDGYDAIFVKPIYLEDIC